MVGVPMAHE